MARFTKEQINSIFLRVPDLRYMIGKSFRKVTGICPNEIVRGTFNSSEAGYQPQGAEPRDFTDFEQILTGDPVIIEWEDSVEFPFDGDIDRRFNKSSSTFTTNSEGKRVLEKDKITPLGTVFEHDDEEYTWRKKEYKLPKLKDETDEEYQKRFKKEFITFLEKFDKLPPSKDRWGREIRKGINTKYFVRKFKTGRPPGSPWDLPPF